MRQRNARIGILLFGVYVALYGGFLLLNAFSPETMEMTPLAGVNLAILYGFGLIVAALVLALTSVGRVPESVIRAMPAARGVGSVNFSSAARPLRP